MIVYSEKYLLHNQDYHPENNRRLKAIMGLLTKRDVFERVPLLEPTKAHREDILRVHSREYYNMIEELSTRGSGMLGPDTYIDRDTFAVALLAAGGVKTCVDKVFEGYGSAFALVRPPGHHATQDSGMGFCIFNNVAVGAAYARSKYRLDRIAVLDYDAHHGNGTQEMFYDDSRVLYISLHQQPLYPGTGSVEEVGAGRGEGYNINIPLPPMVCDQSCLKAYREIAQPILKQYKPQLILVSAGFDSHRDDPMAGMKLSTNCYYEISKDLMALKSKLVFSLEGGYSPNALANSILSAISPLFDVPCEPEEPSAEDERITSYVNSKITAAKNAFSKYWEF